MEKGAIFDLDGTLLYTLEDLKEATNFALCKFAVKKTHQIDKTHYQKKHRHYRTHRNKAQQCGFSYGNRFDSGKHLLFLLDVFDSVLDDFFLGGFSGGEEFFGDLREGDVGQNVLVASRHVFKLRFSLFELGLQSVRETAGNGFFVAERLFHELLVDFTGSFAVFAAAVRLDFLADYLVTFALEHVVDRLNADHLAHGRDQRRITEVLSDPGGLDQNFLQSADRVLHLELGDKVRQHSSGDLVVQRLGVGSHDLGIQQTACEILVADGFEEGVDLVHDFFVDVDFVTELF